MANLVNQLKSVAKENRNDSERISAVTQAQRLIADKGAEDMGILQALGMHHSVKKAIDIHGRRLELESLEKEYGDVFSKEDIKNVACKYALKFLRSDNYKEAIEPVMIQKIKQFFADNGMEVNQAKLGYNFFVLAPPSAFNLVDRPKPKAIDPILFYKLDENNYKLIHKWGADLTPFRRLIGLWNQSIFLKILKDALLWLIPIVFFSIMHHNDHTVYGKQEVSGWSVCIFFLIFVPMVVYILGYLLEDWTPYQNFKPWSERYQDGYRN